MTNLWICIKSIQSKLKKGLSEKYHEFIFEFLEKLLSIEVNKIDEKPLNEELLLDLVNILTSSPDSTSKTLISKLVSLLTVNEKEIFTKYLFQSSSLWKQVFHGISEDSSEIRKFSLKILKIFNNRLNSSKFDHEFIVLWPIQDENQVLMKYSANWDQYITLAHNLENSQTHIIKPLLEKFHNSIKRPSLPNCWLLQILKRMLDHDNRVIQKDALLMTLQIVRPDFFMDNSFCDFVSKGLFKALQNTELFNFSAHPDSIFALEDHRLVPDYLKDFFVLSFKNSVKKDKLILNLVESFMKMKWSQIPVLFVGFSIFNLPSYQCLDDSILSTYLNILNSNFLTQPKVWRKSLISMSLKGFLKFLDPQKVSWDNILKLVQLALHEDCLKPKSSSWIEVKSFVLKSFKHSGDTKKTCKQFVEFVVSSSQANMKYLALLAVILFDDLLPPNFRIDLQDLISQMKTSLKDNQSSLDIFRFVDHLLTILLSFKDYQNEFIFELFKVSEDCLKIFADYFIQNLPEIIFKDDFDSIFNCIEKVFIFYYKMEDVGNKTSFCCDHLIDEILSFISKFLSSHKNIDLTNDHLLVSSSIWKIYIWCLELVQFEKLYFKKSMFSDILKTGLILNKIQMNKETQHKNWNRNFSMFLRLQFTSIHKFIHIFDDFENPMEILSKITDDFDIIAIDNLPVTCQVIGSLLKKSSDLDEFNNFGIVDKLSILWNYIKDISRNSQYKTSCKLFIKAIFQFEIISRKDVFEDLTDLINDVLSLKKTFIMKLVAESFSLICCKISSLAPYVDLMVKILSFTSLPSKEDENLKNAMIYLKEEDTDHFSGDILKSNLKIIMSLSTSDEDHLVVGDLLFQKLLEKDQKISEGKRCLFGSVIHHQRHRIWTWLLLLSEFVSQEQIEDAVEVILLQISKQMQPSVRHLAEWLLAIIIHKFPVGFNQLKSKLQKTDKDEVLKATNSHMTSSLLVCLCDLNEESWQDKRDQLIELIPYILRRSWTQNILIYLHAKAILLRIKSLFVRFDDQLLSSIYPSINVCLQSAETSTGNVFKNWQKMKNSLNIFHLDPIKDLTLETLFSSLPTLFKLSSDLNYDLQKVIKDSTSRIKVRNESNLLSEIKEVWIHQSAADTSRLPPSVISSNNLQFTNSQSKFDVEEKRPGKSSGHLIVVASLVEKSANLGGLTRTCEIFGAKKILVNDRRCLEDKTFQSIAVSSHKWIEIEEVKIRNLKSYLLEMKTEFGYSLVAVEQTAKSQSLADYKFPSRTCLLLGNEREGISEDILQIVDECVEIPQWGVIRSLNVHVSGAIGVWEYSKRHNNKSN